MEGRTALAEMALFATVVNLGSFTKAAQVLDIPKSSLSRRISELESRLGVRLLTRTTRSVLPTSAGTRFHEYCARLVDDAEDAKQAIVRAANAAEGTVRITAPAAFGALYLGSVCAEVMAKHPGITLEVVLSSRFVDLVEEGFDLAIRLGKKLPESSLIARKVGRTKRVLCVSPAYQTRMGSPASELELARHDFLVQGESGRAAQWSFQNGGVETSVPLKVRFWSDHPSALREAALSGLGIACLPIPLIRDDLALGKLVQVLPRAVPREMDVFIVVPSTRLVPARVKAFVDVLMPRLTEQMERLSRR